MLNYSAEKLYGKQVNAYAQSPARPCLSNLLFVSNAREAFKFIRAPHSRAKGDYLINDGDNNEAVSAQLTDRELLKQFKEVEMLGPEDKHLVKTFIDAFITKRHIQELAK